MTETAIAITGGHLRIPPPSEMESFWDIFLSLSPDTLRHGAAPGTDTYVASQVKRLCPWIEVISYPALWNLYGKKAGGIRNRKMLLKPTKVSALIAFPGNTGTRLCISIANERKINITVHYVSK